MFYIHEQITDISNKKIRLQKIFEMTIKKHLFMSFLKITVLLMQNCSPQFLPSSSLCKNLLKSSIFYNFLKMHSSWDFQLYIKTAIGRYACKDLNLKSDLRSISAEQVLISFITKINVRSLCFFSPLYVNKSHLSCNGLI